MNDSSAICVACFKAGGHEEHDYVLYRSESGGCCDCGDAASWQPEGCCALHRPSAAPCGALTAALPPPALAAAQTVLALVFERLALAVEALSAAGASVNAGAAPGADAADAAAERWAAAAAAEEAAAVAALVSWLQRVCSATALRVPAAAALLAGAPPPSGDAPDAQREALARRAAPVGCEAQAALRCALDALPPAAAAAQPLRAAPPLLQRRAWPLVDRLLCAQTLHALREPLLEALTTLLLLVRSAMRLRCLRMRSSHVRSHFSLPPFPLRCCTTVRSRSSSRTRCCGTTARLS
jgi:hypothetical protein